MHGTQYAPRESILCMEHFVALQGLISDHLIVSKFHNETHVPKVLFTGIQRLCNFIGLKNTTKILTKQANNKIQTNVMIHFLS